MASELAMKETINQSNPKPTHLSPIPTNAPSNAPTLNQHQPIHHVFVIPTTTNPALNSTKFPSNNPSFIPGIYPTNIPPTSPMIITTTSPIKYPSILPTLQPLSSTFNPMILSSIEPTLNPIQLPSQSPTMKPTNLPSTNPQFVPTIEPTIEPNGPYIDDTCHLIRNFTCSHDSLVSIQYQITDCDAEDSNDYISSFLDGSLLSTTFSNMGKPLFTNNELTAEFECSNWTHTTISIGDGSIQFMANKYAAFKVDFTIHSNNNSFLALSDIQIQCKPLSIDSIGTEQPSSSSAIDIIISHLNITVAIISVLVIGFCCICVPCFCLCDFYHTRKQKQIKNEMNTKQIIILSKQNLANRLSPASHSNTSETIYKNSPIYLSSPSSKAPEISSKTSPIYGSKQQLNSIQLIKENIASPIHNSAVKIPISHNANIINHVMPIQHKEHSYTNQPYYHPNQIIGPISSRSATSSIAQQQHIAQQRYDFNNVNNGFPNTMPVNQLYMPYKTVSSQFTKSITSPSQNVSITLPVQETNDNENMSNISKSESQCSTCSTSSHDSNSKSTETKSIDMDELMDTSNAVNESIVSSVCCVREPSALNYWTNLIK